jgi:hypothetical protein
MTSDALNLAATQLNFSPHDPNSAQNLMTFAIPAAFFRNHGSQLGVGARMVPVGSILPAPALTAAARPSEASACFGAIFLETLHSQ